MAVSKNEFKSKSMKIICSLSVLLIGSVSCNSPVKTNQQIPAMTNKGAAVVLNNDGTWAYADKANSEKISSTDSILNLLASNNSNSIFLLKSEKANVAIKVNTEKWKYKKTNGDEASEYTFDLKQKDAYAYLITERIEMSLKTLKKLAFENAQDAAPDIKITDEEYKKVNGVQVLFLKMEGTVETLKFSYLGYYYSSKKGTIQFLTATTQNLLKENQSDMEELLNGMVITE
jgi:hypothetical protein